MLVRALPLSPLLSRTLVLPGLSLWHRRALASVPASRSLRWLPTVLAIWMLRWFCFRLFLRDSRILASSRRLGHLRSLIHISLSPLPPLHLGRVSRTQSCSGLWLSLRGVLLLGRSGRCLWLIRRRSMDPL